MEYNRIDKFNSSAARIGLTPLAFVQELAPLQIYSKLEYLNPSGSHYDRAYLPTIKCLEADGLVRPGDELRDISSGSAGISLAWLGTALDYRVRITIPDEIPEARLTDMRAYGAYIVRSGPGYIHNASAFQKAEILDFIRSPNWHRLRSLDKNMRAIVFENKDDGRRVCYVNHSENDITPYSFEKIGHEAVSQLVEAPEAIVLAVGNWTTIAGITPVARKAWPKVKIIGYEGCPSDIYENFGTTTSGSTGTDLAVRFRNIALLDELQQVSATERDQMGDRVNSKRPNTHKIGRSSLMGLVVAERAAKTLGGTVVSIAYDIMKRY